MKSILRAMVLFFSSLFNGRYAGKMIGMFDFCRNVICSNPKTFAGKLHERMKLTNILPESSFEEMSLPATDKIKVRIMYPAGCSWNNIQTLYEAFCDDPKFQTIVVVENYPRFISIMEKVGCNYITLDTYDVKKDFPDIFVASYYSSSNPEINFPNVHNYVRILFAAIPNVVMNEKDNDIHWSFIRRAYKYMSPDYFLCERPVYNSLKDYVPSEKLIELGNPQYDEIFREVGKHHDIPETWNKLKGKKIFLWATDHGINESGPTNGFTIDLYIASMFDYFKKHQDKALIFRPHPEFVREMQYTGHFWSPADVQKIKDYCASTPNVVWDDTHDYCYAFDMCDAFIVDLNCSITCAALTTGKPICRLKRTDLQEWQISPELEDCYYYAKGMEQIILFMDLVSEGRDKKQEQRNLGIERSILHFDGLNGKRMKKTIEELYARKNKMG